MDTNFPPLPQPEIPPVPENSRPNSVTFQPPTTPVKPVPPQKQSLTLKIVIIAALTLVLLIPGLMISSLNDDRQKQQIETTAEISKSWSGSQMISGPILSIPFSGYRASRNDTTLRSGTVRLLPSRLNVNGDLTSQTLHRSIYEAVVYNADMTIAGEFNLAQLQKSEIPMSLMEFDRAYVTIGIGDLKGLESMSPLKFGDTELNMSGTSNPQVYVKTSHNNNTDYDEEVVEVVSVYEEEELDFNYYKPGNDGGCMQCGIELSEPSADNTIIPFGTTIKFKGSQSLSVTPIGGESVITLKGSSSSPSFGGMFIPTTRKVTDNTFDATWKLNSNNREYPQIFTGDRSMEIAQSGVAVNLLVPVDRYQKVERALKYAVVVILLTFIAVLFAEILTRKPIHPFQYLLIGLALILFYSLLLALSEHMRFGLSYLIASIMTIGLVGLYMRGILSAGRTAAVLTGLLIITYIFIYVLLCLNTYALLVGSIGLFIALAAVMYVSLHINRKEPGSLQ